MMLCIVNQINIIINNTINLTIMNLGMLSPRYSRYKNFQFLSQLFYIMIDCVLLPEKITIIIILYNII